MRNQLSRIESQILTRKDEESQSFGSAVYLGPLAVLVCTYVKLRTSAVSGMLTWLPNSNGFPTGSCKKTYSTVGDQAQV